MIATADGLIEHLAMTAAELSVEPCVEEHEYWRFPKLAFDIRSELAPDDAQRRLNELAEAGLDLRFRISLQAVLPDSPGEAAEPPLIAQLLRLFEEDRRDEALDLIYDHVDDLLMARQLNEVDGLLAAASNEDLPMTAWLSLLTVTLPWRDFLGSGRQGLVDAVRDRALREGGPVKAQRVLSGLE